MLFVRVVSRSGLVYCTASLRWYSWWIGISEYGWGTKVIFLFRHTPFFDNRVELAMENDFFLCLPFRFITTNIRNELDYSPQTIYWLGGKFESNKHLKWNDGSNISYKVNWVKSYYKLYISCNIVYVVWFMCYVFRDGFKVNAMLRKHRKKLCASVYNGKYRVHRCYHLAYFGLLIIVHDSVVTYANAEIKITLINILRIRQLSVAKVLALLHHQVSVGTHTHTFWNNSISLMTFYSEYM